MLMRVDLENTKTIHMAEYLHVTTISHQAIQAIYGLMVTTRLYDIMTEIL